MAITHPVMFTPIEDAEVAYGKSTSDELIKKLVQNVNLLGKLAIIGSIRAIALNQPGVTAPDSLQWQRANGDEITEGTSPLRTTGVTNRYTPDTRGRYIRGANAGTIIGNELGGNATIDLSHSHGGATGSASFATVGEEGSEQSATGPAHIHGISSALSPSTVVDLANQQVDLYLKIT